MRETPSLGPDLLSLLTHLIWSRPRKIKRSTQPPGKAKPAGLSFLRLLPRTWSAFGSPARQGLRPLFPNSNAFVIFFPPDPDSPAEPTTRGNGSCCAAPLPAALPCSPLRPLLGHSAPVPAILLKTACSIRERCPKGGNDATANRRPPNLPDWPISGRASS